MAHTLHQGCEKLLRAVEALQTADEAGLHYTELQELLEFPESDKNSGWISHGLRQQGFLCQVEGTRLYILRDAPVSQGYWVRHRELGVVKVTYAREGFPMVKVRKLGEVKEDDAEVRVLRSELSGS